MNRYEIALDYFRQKYNCCQSVLLAFQDVIGLDEQKALDIAGGYGSGAGTGELCGAVNGGIMALGLLTPIDKAEPFASKRRTMALAKELQERFAARFTHVRCGDLLREMEGFVPNDDTPVAKAMGLTKHCEIMVVTAVELVEQILSEREAAK